MIDCLERFGDRIDWAMVILNPLEPWPGELVLPAAERHDVKLITRVVDYGGLFHDDVLPGHEFPRYDHRGFRPAGWVEAGRAKLEAMRPIAERHGLTMLQLACHWNLAHGPVACVAPTLIEEPGSAQVDRGQARRTGRGARPERAQRRGGRGDPRDRRQHAARCCSRAPRPTSRASRCPTAGRFPGTGRAGRPLGHRAGPGPAQSRLKAGAPGR